MELNHNAVKAGCSIFAGFGAGIGLLIYFVIDGDELLGAVFALVVLMILAALSPILATIVGAIIAKDFDDESDAALNGAIVGAAGTLIMILVTLFLFGIATDDLDDADSQEAEDMSDEINDVMVKILISAAVGGALGAFVGFRYLWAKMPATETQSGLPPLSPPQF